MARTVGERSNSKDEMFRRMGENWANGLRVSMPGIIQSFDEATQTVTVQPAIREKIRNLDLSEQWVDLPLLLDVPIVFPIAGGYSLTLPIQPGDECLVVFSDMCIDAWFSSGDVQNQIEKRRHDLSDAFAIIGIVSQPRAVANYSTNTAQLRNTNGTAYVEIDGDNVNLVGNVSINGIDFSTHVHKYVNGLSEEKTHGPEVP